MQVSRMVQAAALMLIVALAASCAASKEYSSKLFKPRTEAVKDSQALALRFLELDKLDAEKENWVSTDIIMGRDTISATSALDNFAKIFPASTAAAKDTAIKIKEDKSVIAVSETKPFVVPEEAKNTEATNIPIAKTNTTGTRNKRIRTEKTP